MKMKKAEYFKITFVAIVIGLTVGQIVYGLLTKGIITDLQKIQELIFRSLFVAILTALVLGILNMYFKILPIQKTGNDNLR
jgi:hypothetical protein